MTNIPNMDTVYFTTKSCPSMGPRHCLQFVPTQKGKVVLCFVDFVAANMKLKSLKQIPKQKSGIKQFVFNNFKHFAICESIPQSTALVWIFWSAASTSASVSLRFLDLSEW